MLISAPTHHDMKEWIQAFRLHQIDTMEARSKFFEKKLERTGVKVPRGSVLLLKGLNAPLEGISQQAVRTMSAGPNNLRTFSEITGVSKEANLAMSSIGEEIGDDEEEELKQEME